MRFQLDIPVIREDYQYQNDPSWFGKAFPSLAFYKKMLGVVFRAARLAKRGEYTDAAWCVSSYNILKALEGVGTRVDLSNLENIQALEEPCVIVGNHMSTLETFLLPYLICPFKKVTFVVKEALISYPIFKHIMISRNPIVVGRSNPKQDLMAVLNDGADRLKDGYSVVVFPQTTRMLEFDKSQFNSIGVKLAKKAGVQVVPLALKTNCWGNGKWIKDFGRIDPTQDIHLEFGHPLDISGNGREQQETIVQHIENCLSKWNARQASSSGK